MAYCNQTLGGLQLDCNEGSKGGIKTVYIANYGDIKGKPTVDENGIITTIPMVDESTKFKPYQFRKQTGSMTSTLNTNDNGLYVVTTELNLVFTKMETKKRLEMSALSKGQLVVIVEDNNGNFYYLGYDDYVSATEGSGSSGVNKQDNNSYSLKLRDESDDFPYFVNPEYVETIVEKE